MTHNSFQSFFTETVDNPTTNIPKINYINHLQHNKSSIFGKQTTEAMSVKAPDNFGCNSLDENVLCIQMKLQTVRTYM